MSFAVGILFESTRSRISYNKSNLSKKRNLVIKMAASGYLPFVILSCANLKKYSSLTTLLRPINLTKSKTTSALKKASDSLAVSLSWSVSFSLPSEINIPKWLIAILITSRGTWSLAQHASRIYMVKWKIYSSSVSCKFLVSMSCCTFLISGVIGAPFLLSSHFGVPPLSLTIMLRIDLPRWSTAG